MKLRFTIFFAVFFLLEVIYGQLFSQWTFIYSLLTAANHILLYISFTGLLFCLPLLFKINKWLLVPWGILLLSFLIINSVSEIRSIDTTKEPTDLEILQIDKTGKKLVVREYTNAKKNELIQDTVLVKDFFIFRQFYDRRKTR